METLTREEREDKYCTPCASTPENYLCNDCPHDVIQSTKQEDNTQYARSLTTGHISIAETVLRDGKLISIIPLGDKRWRHVYRVNSQAVWINASTRCEFLFHWNVLSVERVGQAFDGYL